MRASHDVRSESEMIAFGRDFSSKLQPGDVVALNGEMGAGKTHFCKGVVEGLGANNSVTSPTFSLVQEYRGGKWPVFHFDFYRLESSSELETIGWDEYLDEEGIILVEWAEKFPEVLPEETIELRFERQADESRRVVML